MSEMNEWQNEVTETSYFASPHFLRQQLPYLVVLVLAIAGVGYTNASQQPLVGYWEFLALAVGIVCIITKWPELDNKQAKFRLIWTQAVHWIAVLITMNVILVSSVQQLLPTPAASLVLLTLLALGSFLAGLSLLSPRLCFLGIAMMTAVPAISWLKQSIVFFLLAAMLVIGLGLTIWLPRGRRAASGKE
jgi:hypothetical protein